jgi:1-acyl-sn-glycerol-3-phosphate acyltransferase
MTMLHRAVQVLLLQLMFVGLAWVSVVWNLLAFFLYPVLPRETAICVGRLVISRVYGGLWGTAGMFGMLKVDASSLERLRDEPGLIIVANHPTVLDALLLVSRLPRSACLMKASLMANPLLGPGARLARYIRNDTVVGTIRCCVKDLRRGGQLIMFPEGTRTSRFPINEFRPGVTAIAKIAKAPIQTVFIDTDSAFTSKGWPLWKLPPTPVRFTLRLGQRFEPQRDDAALLKTIENYLAAGVTTNVVENLARARGQTRS